MSKNNLGLVSFLYALWLFFSLIGCSRHEQAKKEKIRAYNAKKEMIARHHDECKYALPSFSKKNREKYPWEEKQVGGFPKITKEFFCCKGSALHPLRESVDYTGNMIKIMDCGGKQKHSLPIKNDNEFIYPILLDILNFIQERTEKKTIITCGHRCPKHNHYADPSKSNQTSKHLIGAEVDFYIKDLEYNPEKIVQIIQEFYREREKDPEYLLFRRDNTRLNELKVAPWYNKEVYIKILQKDEGRDFDNRHPYPYISIQVRYDREEKRNVNYNWEKAHKGYLQW